MRERRLKALGWETRDRAKYEICYLSNWAVEKDPAVTHVRAQVSLMCLTMSSDKSNRQIHNLKAVHSQVEKSAKLNAIAGLVALGFFRPYNFPQYKPHLYFNPQKSGRVREPAYRLARANEMGELWCWHQATSNRCLENSGMLSLYVATRLRLLFEISGGEQHQIQILPRRPRPIYSLELRHCRLILV